MMGYIAGYGAGARGGLWGGNPLHSSAGLWKQNKRCTEMAGVLL